jgi:hypothetical protein
MDRAAAKNYSMGHDAARRDAVRRDASNHVATHHRLELRQS